MLGGLANLARNNGDRLVGAHLVAFSNHFDLTLLICHVSNMIYDSNIFPNSILTVD